MSSYIYGRSSRSREQLYFRAQYQRRPPSAGAPSVAVRTHHECWRAPLPAADRRRAEGVATEAIASAPRSARWTTPAPGGKTRSGAASRNETTERFGACIKFEHWVLNVTSERKTERLHTATIR